MSVDPWAGKVFVSLPEWGEMSDGEIIGLFVPAGDDSGR